MTFAKLGAALFAGALSVACLHTSASAASIETNLFLNNAVPNLDFVERSARMAMTNSKNPRVKEFARGEAKEQKVASFGVDQWIGANRAAQAVLASAAVAPDGTVTGRSVAVDGAVEKVAGVGAPLPPDNRLAMGQEDLDFMEGLTGRDFDDAFKVRQVNALTQLQTDYETYLAVGDDGDLVRLAKRELPKINKRLLMLKKI